MKNKTEETSSEYEERKVREALQKQKQEILKLIDNWEKDEERGDLAKELKKAIKEIK